MVSSQVVRRRDERGKRQSPTSRIAAECYAWVAIRFQTFRFLRRHWLREWGCAEMQASTAVGVTWCTAAMTDVPTVVVARTGKCLHHNVLFSPPFALILHLRHRQRVLHHTDLPDTCLNQAGSREKRPRDVSEGKDFVDFGGICQTSLSLREFSGLPRAEAEFPVRAKIPKLRNQVGSVWGVVGSSSIP